MYDWYGMEVVVTTELARFKRRSSAERQFFPGGMRVSERLAVCREGASFAVVAALAWLSVWVVSCPQVSVKSVSKAGVEITAAILPSGPIMVAIEDDDSENQKDDLEPCGLPGVRLASPPSLTLAQITPPQSDSLSVLTPAQLPLRC
jgi:hypothetical protein